MEIKLQSEQRASFTVTVTLTDRELFALRCASCVVDSEATVVPEFADAKKSIVDFVQDLLWQDGLPKELHYETLY